MLFKSFTAFFLLFPFVGQAIMNIESVRDKDKQGLSTELSFGLTKASGNTNSSVYEGGLRLDHLKKTTHLLFMADGKRGEVNDLLYQYKGGSHLRWTEDITHSISGELFTQAQFDDFLLLEARYLFGAGARFEILSSINDRFKLFFGTGLMKEEEYYQPGAADQHIWRSTNYLSFIGKLTPTANLSIISYYQVAVGDSKDYRIVTAADLRFKISDILSFSFEVDSRYDNDPAFISLERHDLEIKNGIKVSF